MQLLHHFSSAKMDFADNDLILLLTAHSILLFKLKLLIKCKNLTQMMTHTSNKARKIGTIKVKKSWKSI